MENYKKSAIIPKQQLSLVNMEGFGWEAAIKEVESGVPCLTRILTCIVQRSLRSLSTKRPQVGQLIMTTLFSRFPRTFKFFPQWNSLQLFKHGNSHVLEQSLNKLGLTMGIKGTRAIATAMCKETSLRAQKWKLALEGEDENEPIQMDVHGSTGSLASSDCSDEDDDMTRRSTDCSIDHCESEADSVDTLPIPSESPLPLACESPAQLPIESAQLVITPASTVAYGDTNPPLPSRRCLFKNTTKTMEDDDPGKCVKIYDTGHPFPGYQVVWDNVGKLITRAHQNTDNQNIYAMFAMTLLVKNRVSFRHLQDTPIVRRAATTIPVDSYLGKSNDWDELRRRMEIMVSRILVTHIPNFQELTSQVCWHIPHEFTDQSEAKSELINTGVIKG